MKHGNMTCYPSGRKKSYNAWSTKKKKVEWKDSVLPASTKFVRATTHNPSVSNNVQCTVNETLSREERLKISSGYTVAPAYNKGAYQVIPRDQVENIGK
jgi:hypothetical protein